MIVICYGMQKSASTFTFQIAQDIAQTISDQIRLSSTLPEKLQHPYVGEGFDDALRTIIALIPDNEIYIIKTHHPLTEYVKSLLVENQIKAIVSYRDPYDIVVSLKEAGEKERLAGEKIQRFAQIETYNRALNEVLAIIEIAEPWLKSPATFKVPFPKITKETVNVARDMATYLQIPNTNVTEIVELYLSGQKPIWEFNVGLEGRGHQELKLSDDNKVKKEMDRFICLYL